MKLLSFLLSVIYESDLKLDRELPLSITCFSKFFKAPNRYHGRFSSPVLHPRLCRLALSIIFQIYRLKDREKIKHKLSSLLGNFQDVGLRARFSALARPCQTTLPLEPEIASNCFLFPNHGIEDRSLTSNSLDRCCCVIKFDSPHVSYQRKIYPPPKRGLF